MSLDKAIFYKKEKRKPYYDSRRFDRTCCNNGSCEWCKSNRLYTYKRDSEKMDYEELQYKKGKIAS